MSLSAILRPQAMLSKLRYLSEIDIFQDLSPEEVARMDQATPRRMYEKGHVFYSPHVGSEVLFLLKHGRVQLYRMSPQGKKHVISNLGPGSMFGEMSMVGQGLYNTYAEALDDCLLCVLTRADLEQLLLDKPAVGLRMVETLGERLREAEARLEDIAFKNIPARLASLLLRLQAAHGDVIQGYTHQDLAEMIGTYRETTTQTLNDFKREGLLSIGRKRLELHNLDGLREIADA